MFPSGQAPVAYYGDSDFSDITNVAFTRDATLSDTHMDDCDVAAVIATLPADIRNNFALLKAVWQDKVPSSGVETPLFACLSITSFWGRTKHLIRYLRV